MTLARVRQSTYELIRFTKVTKNSSVSPVYNFPWHLLTMASETGWKYGKTDVECMHPPPGDDSWIDGDITGLDTNFTGSIMPSAISLLTSRNPADKRYIEIPYDEHAMMPDCWSEEHEPALRFLSEWQYNLFQNGKPPAPLISGYAFIFVSQRMPHD